MTDPSTFRSHCPTNYALEHFGDRWTLLIIRDLLFLEKQYFREFLSGEEAISTNILSDRLKKMEKDGLIAHRSDPADARRQVYLLTDKGIDLARIMVEINRWSAKHDPFTDVPPDYARRVEEDFESVIAQAVARARAKL
ncbi:HxlR family transcriptional regulator [Actibacterium atlanticum]|uniref:HxlR family transcriptional regulator n=1 Tax=Actibacterium atlanticum TaxID=1461693 RepID=A0A058ZR10_9RHOB|nr:helix-turn-helix domain-containing protein [Actibacterium atlanticum]KCV83607.1 HxlR family transcriptional regulator [Actibacterium atlanticum]